MSFLEIKTFRIFALSIFEKTFLLSSPDIDRDG